MNDTTQNIHLIVEHCDASPSRFGSVLMIEPTPIALSFPGNAPALERQSKNHHAQKYLMLQAHHGASSPRLVIVSNGGARVMLNGEIAPSIAIARAGDEIEIVGMHDIRLHVAIHRASSLSNAGESTAGRNCPVCLTPIETGQSIYRCACGTAMHFAATASESCASENAFCPDCGRAVVTTSGYEIFPEGFHADEGQNNSPPLAAAER